MLVALGLCALAGMFAAFTQRSSTVWSVLWAAVDALAQGYDHLVIDAGAQQGAALASIAAQAPFAVLVGGEGAQALEERRHGTSIGSPPRDARAANDVS